MGKLGGSLRASLGSQSVLAILRPTPALPSPSGIPLPSLNPGGLLSPLHLSLLFLSPQPTVAQCMVTVSELCQGSQGSLPLSTVGTFCSALV